MIEITKEIRLDVASENRIQSIRGKQYDFNSRQLKVWLVNEGVPIIVPSGTIVTINAMRADGQGRSFLGKVNEDGSLTVPIEQWMLILDDRVFCDVSVIDTEGRRLSTMNFTLEVERANCTSGQLAEVSASVGASSGITAASVDGVAFIQKIGTSDPKDYTFSYAGNQWVYQSVTVSLAEYGITPVGTPTSGDQIIVTVSDNWVDAIGLPSGGVAGQILRKKSAKDYDVGWETPTSTDLDAIHYTAEVKTDAQKAQARQNIGAQATEVGKGLSSNDYDDTAKAKVDAIPGNPKYTDTVYDDTSLKNRLTAIEGQEAVWNAKGTYSKPSGGIPKSDLAAAVQTSLGKADTALQSHQDISGKVDTEQLKNYVRKSDTAGVLYGTKEEDGAATETVYSVSGAAAANSVPLRDANGRMKAALPAADDDVATQGFVNSSITNYAADYISDNGEPFGSLEALNAYTTANPGKVGPNDYAIVKGTDSAGNTVYTRYKYSRSTKKWGKEYDLNNSTFTAAQWATINSGISKTSLNGKQETLVSGTNIKTINGESLLGSGNIVIQGEKGATGNSGVYIGSTAPTDASVMVWINPDGEATAIYNGEVS